VALIPPALAPAAYAAMNIASATGIVFANKAGESTISSWIDRPAHMPFKLPYWMFF
jgi:hypothetical protein